MKRRSRLAAAGAVVALTGALVAAGAITASAEPNSITIDQISGDVLTYGPVTGTMDLAGDSGIVYVDVTNSAGTTRFCETASYAYFDSTWTCAISLEYGDNTIVASAEQDGDPGNPISTTPIVWTFGSTQQATIDSPPSGVTIPTFEQAFTGTGPHMGTVTVEARLAASSDPFAPVCGPIDVGEDGAWDCTATFPSEGTFTVHAVSTLVGGLTGTGSADRSLTVDDPTDLAITAPSEAVAGQAFAVEGTADADDTSAIDVRLGTDVTGTLLCTATWTTGSWTCDSGPLTPGDYTITAWQDTRASASVPVTVLVPAPNVSQPLTWTITEGDDAFFSGTTTYDDVIVDVDVEGLGTCGSGVWAASGSAWGCSPGTPLPGTYSVTIVQQLGTFPSESWVGTLIVEGVLRIGSPGDGDRVTWQAGNFLVVEGTTPSSEQLDVYLDADPTPVCTTTPDTSWACPGIALDPGPHVITASQETLGEASVEVDILLPRPETQPSYTFDEGSTNAVFAGTATYADASTRVTVFEDFGEGPGPQLATTTCPYGTASTYSCMLDLSALSAGSYLVQLVHFLPAQPLIEGSVSERYVYIGSAPSGAPTLGCAFSPAAVSITTSEPGNIGIYTLVPSPDDEGYQLADQGFCGGDTGYRDPSVTFWDDAALGGGEGANECDTGCELTGLLPGIYEVYYAGSGGGSEGEGYFDYLFRIPETPHVSATASSAADVALTGTATAGDIVRVVDGPGQTLCTTTTTGAGAWACTFPKSTAATARALGVDPQSTGISAFSAAVDIPIRIAPLPPTVTPLPPITVAPSAPAGPPAPSIIEWFLETGDLMNLRPGDTFTIGLTGVPQGWTVEIIMHSTPVSLGSRLSDGGPMSMTLTVPQNIESGPHEIEVVATTELGTNYFQHADAQVIGGVDPVAEPSPGPDDAEDAGAGSPAGAGSDRNDPAAPSGITGKLAPLSAIVANPAAIAIAGGLALALLFLVALPTELLNSSLSSNTSRLGRAYGAVDGAMTKAQDWLIRVTRSRAVAAGILVVLVAVIYGFVDPGFGFDIVSLRLVLSLGIAFFVLTFIASWISGMIIRRAWGAMGVVAMQPSIILFAIVGVIVARVLDFSPGFLVGVAIGLELLQASRTVTAKAVFVQLGVVTGLSLAAWVVYSFFTPGNDFFGMLLEDSMVAVTAEGLTGALIAVFPLKFLDGRELWDVSKRLWVAAFLIVSTAFALLVLPTAIEGTDVSDYGTWLVVFAVFGLVSLAVWLVFVRADAKAAKADDEKVDA